MGCLVIDSAEEVIQVYLGAVVWRFETGGWCGVVGRRSRARHNGLGTTQSAKKRRVCLELLDCWFAPTRQTTCATANPNHRGKKFTKKKNLCVSKLAQSVFSPWFNLCHRLIALLVLLRCFVSVACLRCCIRRGHGRGVLVLVVVCLPHRCFCAAVFSPLVRRPSLVCVMGLVAVYPLSVSALHRVVVVRRRAVVVGLLPVLFVRPVGRRRAVAWLSVAYRVPCC